MLLLVKRWLALVFICASFAFAQTAFAASEWEVIKVSGHDYLSIDNISRFYGLPAGVAGAGDKIRFETVKNPLEFVSGSREAMINVARKLRPLLQAKGLRVIMTREGDYFVPLEVRAQIANKARNSIFVSIHFNGTNDDPDATGFEIFSFTPRGAPSTSDSAVRSSSFNMQPGSQVDGQSMALSACIYHSLLGHIPEYDRGIKRARFAVLRLTKVPAVLIEGGFLTERGESKLIANKDWRGKLAAAIGVGIESYQSLGGKKQPPMLVADYRRQTKLEPTEPVIQEENLKEVDASLINLVGKSKFASPTPASTSPASSSPDSAVIVP